MAGSGHREAATGQGESYVRRHLKASSAGLSTEASGAYPGRVQLIPFAILGLLVALLVWGVASASATTYAPGTPPTFCTGVGGAAGQCQNLLGTAVDSSNGHVYVLDMAGTGGRIDEYTSSGTFVRAFGLDVIASGQHNAGTGYEVCEPSNSTPTDVCKAGIKGPNNSGGEPEINNGGVNAGFVSVAVDPTTHIVYAGGVIGVKY